MPELVAFFHSMIGLAAVFIAVAAVAEPHAFGITPRGAPIPTGNRLELFLGAASLGQIITRDRDSRVHDITAGQAAADGAAIIGSEQLAVTIEALARSYEHVVLNAGGLSSLTLDPLAQLAPTLVLVADAIDDPMTRLAQARLAGAGFKSVSVLACAPPTPQSGASDTQAAA